MMYYKLVKWNTIYTFTSMGELAAFLELIACKDAWAYRDRYVVIENGYYTVSFINEECLK